MQRISTSMLSPGMFIASNIYSSNGQLLFRSDTVLTEMNISRIRKMPITSVYVKNPMLENIHIPQLISESTRVTTAQSLNSVVVNFLRSGKLGLDRLKIEVNALVDEVILNKDAMVHFQDARTFDDYIICHSVNVCIMATLTALNMGYSRIKLQDFALGALLHDLGMTMVDKSILGKIGKLSPEEIQIVQDHNQNGFNVLRKLRDISTPAAHIAFQHHERFNGKGYPRQLKGKEIHEYARITSIADIYDALISDRPYRNGLLPHEVYEILMTLADTHIDREILNVFLENVAVYPVGTIVKVSSGELGVVIKVSPKLTSRPTIRVLFDKHGNRLNDNYELDLLEHLSVFVEKVLKEKEIFDLGSFA